MTEMNPHRIASALRELAAAIEDDGGRAAAPPPPLKIQEREVLTREEAAELLQMHAKQVTLFVKTKGLPGQKMGRGWRFRRSELLAWLARQGQGAH